MLNDPSGAQPATAPRRSARPSTWRAAIEPLWHRRRIEVYGTLMRVAVPVIGAPITPAMVVGLQGTLDAQWRGRTLSLATEIHSVVVELHERDGLRELVLLISIDRSPRDHSLVGARMLRGLRGALRATRSPVADQGISAAA